MPWLTNKETGGHFNTDWIDKDNSTKERQISENKKQASDNNDVEKNKPEVNPKVRAAADTFKQKWADFYKQHPDKLAREINTMKNMNEYYMGNEMKGKLLALQEVQAESESATNWKPADNYKFGPNEDDVTSVKDYFEGTDVKVNTSLKDWVTDTDKQIDKMGPGIARAVNDYMEDSSINTKMISGKSLETNDRQLIDALDRFTVSGSVPKGTILYSGLTSEQSEKFWNSGDKLNYHAYLSTSPDPVYARGYSLNTDTMLQIECTSDIKLGKCYYEDSTGTEGILGRNKTYKITGQTTGMVNGEKVKIIKVQI